jgi:hypothetical protein
VKVASAQLEVVVRGCSVTNLPIESLDGSRPLGIVNSTFEPPLAGSLKTVQAPSCGAVVAGERVCDERARCDSIATGGVVCACVGAGLRYKAGVPEDGRRCEQDAKLSSVLESESVFVAVTKPGVQTGHLRLVSRAEGEGPFSAAFRVSMSLIGSEPSQPVNSIGVLSVEQRSIAAFGLHIDWVASPPPANWTTDLNGNAFKYSETKPYEFRVRLCSECACLRS